MASFTTRPVVMGRKGVVASGHYLASAAGFRILEQGGNAFDAATAVCLCQNLVEPQSCGIGGEVPTLIYPAAAGRPYALSGMGWSPEAFTIDWCREHGIDLIPGDGFLPACVPSVVGSWALALARFGTMSFTQVLQPAIELADEGFALYPSLQQALRSGYEKYTELYPTTGEVYLPGGRIPDVGEVIRNPDWAGVLKGMCRAEKEAAGKGRVAGIEAAAAYFYRGPVAERIVDFIRSNPVEDASGVAHRGLLSLSDMADWEPRLESPVSYHYHGLDVHKCPSWTQGPVFVQQLALLAGFDLPAMGHNSVEYLHTLIEVAKLAYADREAYYGDTLFDDVPIERLLSAEYNDGRRELIGERAAMEVPPGDMGRGVPAFAARTVLEDNRWALEIAGRQVRDLGLGHAHVGDTTHLDVIDRWGNMVAATPSGGWLGSSPVVKGLGFPLGTRGQMFYLNADRPNALEPRKRPRATLTPTLVTRHGRPFMVFGTPGGDCQDQWTLQFFLNYVHFGMDMQEALDAPTVHSMHFPSSFYPREGFPGKMVAEGRIPAGVIEGLRARGHEVEVTGDWVNGKTMGIRLDEERGVIQGAVAPKGIIGYAIGW